MVGEGSLSAPRNACGPGDPTLSKASDGRRQLQATWPIPPPARLSPQIIDLTAELSDERLKGDAACQVLEGERAERLRGAREIKELQVRAQLGLCWGPGEAAPPASPRGSNPLPGALRVPAASVPHAPSLPCLSCPPPKKKAPSFPLQPLLPHSAACDPSGPLQHTRRTAPEPSFSAVLTLSVKNRPPSPTPGADLIPVSVFGS